MNQAEDRKSEFEGKLEDLGEMIKEYEKQFTSMASTPQ